MDRWCQDRLKSEDPGILSCRLPSRLLCSTRLPTLRRETAEDVSLDMDADDYPREEGVDSDSDSTFVPEGLDGDDEIDMNIAQ